MRQFLPVCLRPIPNRRKNRSVVGTWRQEATRFDQAIKNFAVTPESPRAMRQIKLAYDKCMSAPKSTNVTKIKNFIDLLGGWPLVFQNLSDPNWNPYRLMGALNGMKIDNIFACPPYMPCIMPNWGNTTKGNMLSLHGAIPLVSREEYEKKGAKATERARKALMDMVDLMSSTFGVQPDRDMLNNDIDMLFLMDYKLAMSSKQVNLWTLTNMTDAFHEFTLDEAKSRWPSFDWETYMRAIALDKIDPDFLLNRTFNLLTPDFMDVLSELPLSPGRGARDAQNYLIFKFLTKAMEILPGFEHHFLHFELGEEKGIPSPSNDRHWVCERMIKKWLKYTTWRLYIDSSVNSLPGEPRQKFDFMTDLIFDGFKEVISKIEWMSDYTREEGLQKIYNLQKNIAYPLWIGDDLALDARHPVEWLDIKEDDDPFDMLVKLFRFLTWSEWHMYTEPIDRTIFGADEYSTPMTINAWYQAWFNSINVPATLIHPPAFDVDFPMAFNLGGIGFVMGHELVHGFDVDGSQFDGFRNLRKWIDDESPIGYKNMTDCLVKEYDNIAAILNGIISV